MKAVIFDVDGTLCNVSAIRWHVDLNDPRNRGFKDFKGFHEAASGAPANREIVALTRALRPDIASIVVTARMRMWEVPTIWWLLLEDARFDHFFMRANGDHRPDYEVKTEILRHIQTRYEVVYAIDDNPSVVRVWQEHGIPTLIVPGWKE